MKILIVGAGFAGATAARELAEAGHRVVVIDKRSHIAGNAYDFVNSAGIRVHKYGPHLWHTSNDEVQAWASRFTEWVPYTHKVSAQLANGETVPLPINNETIEKVFGQGFFDWCVESGWCQGYGTIVDGAHDAFMANLRVSHGEITNSREHIEASVGKELCDLFFAPYTKKMWGLELDELPASVAARIPTNVGTEANGFKGDDRYFPKDKHQCLPEHGYTAMIAQILNHPNISVRLNTSREDIQAPARAVFFQKELGMNNLNFDHVFTSEPIDVYYGCDLGELPWRSIKMHTVTLPLPNVLSTPVVNFTHDGPHTRVTEWKMLPNHGSNALETTLTFEEPCDYHDNSQERYYPVKTSAKDCPHRALYNRYAERAEAEPNVTFIGRCGTFQYLDMWAVIGATLHTTRKFLQRTT